MENPPPRITKDDVIAKIKDDGDFDKLRLKIIRKLKEKEELRNNIVSIVKQSAALNRAGAETVKPRQLSDAIYEEVGGAIMSQLSVGLWEIIRSGDGMKNEIAETVHSVYNRLLNPNVNEGESSTQNERRVQKGSGNNGVVTTVACKNDDMLINEPRGPPGSPCPSDKQAIHEILPKEGPVPMLPEEHVQEQNKKPCHSKDQSVPDDLDMGAPPGFSVILEHKQACDDGDEDPDVPPGFG